MACCTFRATRRLPDLREGFDEQSPETGRRATHPALLAAQLELLRDPPEVSWFQVLVITAGPPTDCGDADDIQQSLSAAGLATASEAALTSAVLEVGDASFWAAPNHRIP